jgi:GT2 family glycosyltransferase
MKTIATLITCHNRKEKTLACLEALFQNTLPAGYTLDVFLVDDGSTDDTAKAVHGAFPQVNIIQGNGDLFWNRGMHKAWEAAVQSKLVSQNNTTDQSQAYDYYLWLNDDTNIFKNTLQVLLQAADSTANKAVIVAASCAKITGELTYSGFLSSGEKIQPTDQLVQAHTFHGNCVLISKLVFQKVGNLDPLFHHSIGDMDYGLRAIKQGVKSFIAPGFLAHCDAHDTLPQWCLASVPLGKRIRSLYSPLGNAHPYYYFRFVARHFGIIVAARLFFLLHLRMSVPQLWEKLRKVIKK